MSIQTERNYKRFAGAAVGYRASCNTLQLITEERKIVLL